MEKAKSITRNFNKEAWEEGLLIIKYLFDVFLVLFIAVMISAYVMIKPMLKNGNICNECVNKIKLCKGNNLLFKKNDC